MILVVAVLGAGCAGPEAPPGTAAPAPAVEAPPAAAAPVADLPRPALLPRSRWKRIPIDTRGNIASAFAASAMVPGPDGLRREWIAVNLKEPIPLPETGGHAASVTFLADYRCDRHAWDPIETIWHPRRDAGGGVALREQPRARGARVVQEGTLIDVFLDAACRR